MAAKKTKEVVEEVQEVVKEVVEDVVEAPAKTKSSKIKTEDTFGEVNVESIYLRAKPEKKRTNAIQILKASDRVKICPADKTQDSDWIKVCTENEIEGYVMKEFITIEDKES